MMVKTQFTRIYDKFTGYTVADCDCKLCRFYAGKKRGCKLDECCCTEERQQAYARETGAETGATAYVGC